MESYFWMAVMLGIGAPYAFWSIMPMFQVLALICAAAYWSLSASGGLLEKKTSGWVVLDFCNAMFLVPFYNFLCLFLVLLGRTEEKRQEPHKGSAGKTILTAGLGLVIAVPVLMIVLPLLGSADAGFERMLRGSGTYFREHFMVILVRMLFALPVSSYLFGLSYGGASERHTDHIRPDSVKKTGRAMRVIPDIAIDTAMVVLCLIYLLFIGLQGTYLFSAFAGVRPEAFTYAEYARRGFFELCDVAVLNLLVLMGANLMTGTERKKNRALRLLNVALSVLTLLLVATAMSKMLMYIGAYGLTEKRVLTVVFMVWLLLVFVLNVIWQWRSFPIVRICVMTGAVLFCLLCLVPVGTCIGIYNRYMGMVLW